MSVDVLSAAVADDVAEPDAAVEPLVSPGATVVERGVTLLVVIAPLLALCYAVVRWWGHGIGWRDLIVAAALYGVIGHGVTVGFHRLFTHRSFAVGRPLKIALGIIGSMAFQGGPIGWVADHRRHHALADRPGDPHSPH